MKPGSPPRYALILVPFGRGGPTPDYVRRAGTGGAERGYQPVVGTDTQFGPHALQDHLLFHDFLRTHPGVAGPLWIDVSPEAVARLYGITREGHPKDHPAGLSNKEFQSLWKKHNGDPGRVRRFLKAVEGHEWDPRKRWPGIDGTLPGRPNFGRYMLDVLVMAEKVGEAVCRTLQQGFIPVTIGGDHSVELGVMAGVARFLAARSGNPVADLIRGLLDMIWLDAHPDSHTLATSESHNIHGMPVSALLGLGSGGTGGHILADLGGIRGKIAADRLTLFGLRDIDPTEERFLGDHGITWHLSGAMLAGFEIGRAMRDHLARNPGGLSVFSADLDGLDPVDAPAVTTAVKGGLRLADYLAILEELHARRGREGVLSYGFYEFNPLCRKPNGRSLLTPGEVDRTIETMVRLLGEIVRQEPPAVRSLPLRIPERREPPAGFQSLEEVDLRGFGFMGELVTVERPPDAQILKTAQVMLGMRQVEKKIAFVGGPAIAHTDAAKYLAALVDAGWIDFFHSGNALAVHDLELAHEALGTSLGGSPQLELETGIRAVPGGPRNHLELINQGREAGSIAALVASGKIRKGSVMRALVENKIDFLLTGSPRDDGPLPDVVVDVAEGRRRLHEKLSEMDLVIGAGTLLHMEAALRELPATTAKVIVDTNAGVVRRLKAGNPLNSLPIVTHAVHFLKNLCEALGVPVDHLAAPTPLGTDSRARVERGDTTSSNPDNPVRTVTVTKDGVAPSGFITSSNEPTFVTLDAGRVIRVERQKMDGVIVVDRETGRVTVKTFRHLKVGDEVVVGEDGVRVERIAGDTTPRTIRAVAERLAELKKSGKPVLLVAGDALVSSGASAKVAELIRRGFITRLHSGTALPLYEVERALHETTGVNDSQALAKIRELGGLTGKNTFQTLAPDGIFAAAEGKGIEVVVGASMNDTGEIPGAVSDMGEVQDRIRALYEGSGLVINAATVLHSVAAGNQGAAEIPVVVVDRDRFAIGKLADRGTVQAHGFQMDTGEFFSRLLAEIERIDK